MRVVSTHGQTLAHTGAVRCARGGGSNRRFHSESMAADEGSEPHDGEYVTELTRTTMKHTEPPQQHCGRRVQYGR